MGRLPQQLTLDMMQNRWGTILDPIISKPIVNSNLLKSITLTSGSNTINHKLGRVLQGWIPVRIRSSATFYDTQDTNQTPELTLILVVSADCVVDLLVF